MYYYIYILQSEKDGLFYTGYTNDLRERFKLHNAGKVASTKNRTPFKIILVEQFENRLLALAREKQVKSWKGGNAFKQLIKGV